MMMMLLTDLENHIGNYDDYTVNVIILNEFKGEIKKKI